MDLRLWGQYAEFCELRRKAQSTGGCDLSGMDWIYPTTLLPLGCFLGASRMKFIPPIAAGVADYISLMLNPASVPTDSRKSYIPLVPLPYRNADADRVLGLVYRLHDHGRFYGGESAFKYFFGEMVDNVYQHSSFRSAFVMA